MTLVVITCRPHSEAESRELTELSPSMVVLTVSRLKPPTVDCAVVAGVARKPGSTLQKIEHILADHWKVGDLLLCQVNADRCADFGQHLICGDGDIHLSVGAADIEREVPAHQ